MSHHILSCLRVRNQTDINVRATMKMEPGVGWGDGVDCHIAQWEKSCGQKQAKQCDQMDEGERKNCSEFGKVISENGNNSTVNEFLIKCH